MTLSSLRRTAVSSSTVQTKSPAESLLLLSPALSSSTPLSKHESQRELKRTYNPRFLLRRYHHAIVSGSDLLGVVKHHFDVDCQEMILEKAGGTSGGWICVLRPRVRLCRGPGVESPGKVRPHITRFLLHELPLNSPGHQKRVLRRAGWKNRQLLVPNFRTRAKVPFNFAQPPAPLLRVGVRLAIECDAWTP